jgi:hypothetical protein
MITLFSPLSGQSQIGDTLMTFDIGSLTPTPDRSITGIEYAAGYFWATGFDPDDYWQHKLYKISPDGSELIETYSYGIEAAGWKDLAYDGEFLYVTDLDTIRQLRLTDGQKTGVTIPAPFYYNQGLAYLAESDHFFVVGDGGSNIYEIDRTGQVIAAIANYQNHGTGGLAVDTISPGGPFLWTWSSESEAYNTTLKASQISLRTYQFTGLDFDGISISNIIVESPGGADIIYNWEENTLALVTVNIRNGNINDQMEYAVIYNITNNEIPGPQIAVNPTSIQNILPPGDSAVIEVNLSNAGMNNLWWSAYVETPEQDTINNLGDTLFSFNASLQSLNNDNGLNGITYLNNKIWVNGRNYPNQQAAIYEFSNAGELLQTHTYNAINANGFTSITSDGEFLYGVDTYAILQIDPVSFGVIGYLDKPSGNSSAMTYDPQTDHFWSGNGNGGIYEFTRDGNEVKFFLTPYNIQGMAWDAWSPGGPYLWVWSEEETTTGSKCRAVRLNPQTCIPTATEFNGFNLGGSAQDTPNGAVITNLLVEDKISFIGLQNNGANNEDFVCFYDLDVVPAPDWISLSGQTYGVVPVNQTGILNVKLFSIMDDTLMTAVVRIANNTIMEPEVVIPIDFTMLPTIISSVDDYAIKESVIIGNTYPNPFHAETIIPVTLKENEKIQFKVYDNTGTLVNEMSDLHLSKGFHELKLNLAGKKAGIYYLVFQTADKVFTQKIILSYK